MCHNAHIGRAQTRALFTYWWVEMGPDNPPGAHCHINHIDYDPTTRAHPPPQDEKEGLQDFMHRHIDAGRAAGQGRGRGRGGWVVDVSDCPLFGWEGG